MLDLEMKPIPPAEKQKFYRNLKFGDTFTLAEYEYPCIFMVFEGFKGSKICMRIWACDKRLEIGQVEFPDCIVYHVNKFKLVET